VKKPSKRLVTIIAVVVVIVLALCVANSRKKDQHTGLDAIAKSSVSSL